MDRLTTDNPANNLETSMNFCFAKDGAAMLGYADGAENVNLCDYTAKCCCKNGCEIDAAYVLQEGLMDCYDCQIAIMYCLGVQAVETRERLKHYEDLAEQGRLDRIQQENDQLREQLEEFQTRQTPQKPTDDECCPICGCYLKDEDDVGGAYCPACGQKIDWIWG